MILTFDSNKDFEGPKIEGQHEGPFYQSIGLCQIEGLAKTKYPTSLSLIILIFQGQFPGQRLTGTPNLTHILGP